MEPYYIKESERLRKKIELENNIKSLQKLIKSRERNLVKINFQLSLFRDQINDLIEQLKNIS